MIIDIHGHLGNINFAPFWQADGKELERLARLAGVDKLCVSSARAIMYDTQEGNRELDETLREADRLYGLVVVNPMFPASADGLVPAHSNPRLPRSENPSLTTMASPWNRPRPCAGWTQSRSRSSSCCSIPPAWLEPALPPRP